MRESCNGRLWAGCGEASAPCAEGAGEQHTVAHLQASAELGPVDPYTMVFKKPTMLQGILGHVLSCTSSSKDALGKPTGPCYCLMCNNAPLNTEEERQCWASCLLKKLACHYCPRNPKVLTN